MKIVKRWQHLVLQTQQIVEKDGRRRQKWGGGGRVRGGQEKKDDDVDDQYCIVAEKRPQKIRQSL